MTQDISGLNDLQLYWKITSSQADFDLSDTIFKLLKLCFIPKIFFWFIKNSCSSGNVKSIIRKLHNTTPCLVFRFRFLNFILATNKFDEMMIFSYWTFCLHQPEGRHCKHPGPSNYASPNLSLPIFYHSSIFIRQCAASILEKKIVTLVGGCTPEASTLPPVTVSQICTTFLVWDRLYTHSCLLVVYVGVCSP